MKTILVICMAVVISSCGPDDNRTTKPKALAQAADPLMRGIQAHGGLDTWQDYGTLEYDFAQGDVKEHHTIDLRSRKTRIESDRYTIGFDGSETWVSPNREAYSGNPHFYSSLHFYFFAIPFVLADPGTRRELLPDRTVGDSVYKAVRISFDSGVGDSPGDYYVPHFSSTTQKLAFLLYTVTYTSGESSEAYGARVYEEWQEVGGLLVPSVIASYRWDNEADTLGVRRGETTFSNVSFSNAVPAAERFERPIEGESYQREQ